MKTQQDLRLMAAFDKIDDDFRSMLLNLAERLAITHPQRKRSLRLIHSGQTDTTAVLEKIKIRVRSVQ